MLNKKRSIFLFIILMLVLSACNLPAGNGDTGGDDTGSGQVDDLALTVTAQYILLNQVTNTPEFTATPQFTATPENTATPSVPQVSVSVNTNCRTGPGLVYDLLGGLNIGQTAEVVGKSSSTGYWIIKLPGSSTICWLFPQHATVSGNTANLPEYPVPPTPTPSLPAAPKQFKANVSCVLQNNPVFVNLVEVKLTWEDVANNESGYRIYEDGTEIVALAADSTSYTYNTTLVAIWLINTPKPSHTYVIEAYNSAGKSEQKSVKVEC